MIKKITEKLKLPSLDERIIYLINNSTPFLPSDFKNEKFCRVTEKIIEAGFEVRKDVYPDPSVPRRIGRFGLCVFGESRPPLIYIVPVMHNSEEELADTLLHEALHATGKPLGRPTVETEQSSNEYLLEELCVWSGLVNLYPMLAFPEMKIKSRKAKEEYAKINHLLAQRVDREIIDEWNFNGVCAAEYIYKLIKI